MYSRNFPLSHLNSARLPSTGSLINSDYFLYRHYKQKKTACKYAVENLYVLFSFWIVSVGCLRCSMQTFQFGNPYLCGVTRSGLFPLIGFFHGDDSLGSFIRIMDPQNCLRPVELDMSGLVLLGSGFFDKFNEFFQNLTGQVAAAPVECKCFILLCSLQGALVNFLRLCEGKFFLFIVK